MHLEIDPITNPYDDLPEMYIPKKAYEGSPGPVTHAYDESPISSKGNLYYSQDEVDLSLSKGKFEGAKVKSKWPKKELGQTAEPASKGVLVRLMHDPDQMVRTEAIEALGELGGVGAALELLPALEEER